MLPGRMCGCSLLTTNHDIYLKLQIYAFAAIGEFFARAASGFELFNGRRSRPQTERAFEMTWTEKKPESSMFVEGCYKNKNTNIISDVK